MGLSASQARLLTLTARLSDLELQAQQISNSKIRLSMQSEQVATDYAAALDKEDLSILSGYNSSGTAEYESLTYDNLTGPDSPLTTQYCLTDTNGNILVTQDEAKAFQQSQNADDFCTLMGAGDTTTFATGVTASQYAAAESAVTSTEAALNTYGASHVEGYTSDGAWEYTTTSTDTSTYGVSYSDSAVYSYLESMSDSKAESDFSGVSTQYKVSYDDINSSSDQCTILNLSGENTSKAKTALTSLIGDVGSDVTEALSSLTGMDSSKLAEAMQYAETQTLSTYESNDWVKKSNRSTVRDDIEDKNTVGIGSEDDTYSVDMSQVIDTLLTYFDQYCASNFGGSTSSSVSGDSTNRSSTGGNASYNGYLSTTNAYSSTDTNADSEIAYITTTGETTASVSSTYQSLLTAYENAEETLESLGTATVTSSSDSDYYTNIYNKMCDGYITMDNESDTINSSAWVQSQIENGNLVLDKCTTDDDGNTSWASTSWASNSDIEESTDDTDTAKAEAVYDAEMAKIDTKDKEFDLELQNIDTEHSAVQTEVDSVQKVIDKNIERSFKIFQNA